MTDDLMNDANSFTQVQGVPGGLLLDRAPLGGSVSALRVH